MSYRNEQDWSTEFVKWVEDGEVYDKAFKLDRLKPTYQADFYRWSIAEQAFCAGLRLGLKAAKKEQ